MSEDVNAHIKYSCSEGAFIAEKLVGNVGKTIGKYSKDHFSLMPEEAIYISQVQRDSRLYSESNEEINSWKIPHYLTDLSRTLVSCIILSLRHFLSSALVVQPLKSSPMVLAYFK